MKKITVFCVLLGMMVGTGTAYAADLMVSVGVPLAFGVYQHVLTVLLPNILRIGIFHVNHLFQGNQISKSAVLRCVPMQKLMFKGAILLQI